MLIGAGLSVKVVSTRLGHKNAAETLNTYAHLFPDDEDNTRRTMEDAFLRRTDDGQAEQGEARRP